MATTPAPMAVWTPAELPERPSARVREDAAFVVEHSADVTVHQDAAERLAATVVSQLKAKSYSLQAWREHEMHPSSPTEDTCNWVFLVDLLNYSFFHDDESKPFAIGFRGRTWTGYWSLCAALNRAQEEGLNLLDMQIAANLSREQFDHVFRSATETPVPLGNQRFDHLRAAAATLLQKYGGSFANVVRAANHSSQALLRLVLKDFPTFRDGAMFESHEVLILKRAQILVADIWGCYQGQGLGQFDDIDELTMFADYRVPQSLVYFGLLSYSEVLLRDLRAGVPLPAGSPREIAIRAGSIAAVEALLAAVRAQLGTDPTPVNAVILDFFLWDLAKADAAQMADVPIHRTRGIFY